MMRSTHAPGRGRAAFVLAAFALIALSLTPPAWARMGGGGHFGGRSGGFSGGHAIGARGGFVHGHPGGHFRGALVIGGLGLWAASPYAYYPYPAYPAYPVYPYAPAVVPGYNAAPPGQVWYYCDAAANYYPYVTTCPGPWRQVPAPPEQSGPGPAP